jgi:hypothetical protein
MVASLCCSHFFGANLPLRQGRATIWLVTLHVTPCCAAAAAQSQQLEAGLCRPLHTEQLRCLSHWTINQHFDGTAGCRSWVVCQAGALAC